MAFEDFMLSRRNAEKRNAGYRMFNRAIDKIPELVEAVIRDEIAVSNATGIS